MRCRNLTHAGRSSPARSSGLATDLRLDQLQRIPSGFCAEAFMAQQLAPAAPAFGDGVRVQNGKVAVTDESALKSERMDALIGRAVFGEQAEKDAARWLIWEIGQAVGVKPASIHDLYLARGRGEVNGFTVPAINVRGMSYDTARAIFRTANRLDAGAFLLEIAR